MYRGRGREGETERGKERRGREGETERGRERRGKERQTDSLMKPDGIMPLGGIFSQRIYKTIWSASIFRLHNICSHQHSYMGYTVTDCDSTQGKRDENPNE